MQDGAYQQRVAGFLPVIASLQRTFGIDEDIGNVLHVAHFMGTTSDFQQRVVTGRVGIRGIEKKAV